MEKLEPPEMVARAERIVVITGAGISTESGIPDFRGPDGVWTQNPEAEAAAHYLSWMQNPESRRMGWERDIEMCKARPNMGHFALVHLERLGKLSLLATQNIDGLHQLAGNSPSKIIELHGNNRSVRCEDCATTYPSQDIHELFLAGDPDPYCPKCLGVIRPEIVMFGEHLQPSLMDRFSAAMEQADLIIAVGTSLSVYPVSWLVGEVVPFKDFIVINQEPTDLDRYATWIITQPIGQVLPDVLEMNLQQKQRICK